MTVGRWDHEEQKEVAIKVIDLEDMCAPSHSFYAVDMTVRITHPCLKGRWCTLKASIWTGVLD